jgi:hypothetical protein
MKLIKKSVLEYFRTRADKMADLKERSTQMARHSLPNHFTNSFKIRNNIQDKTEINLPKPPRFTGDGYEIPNKYMVGNFDPIE